MGKDGDIFLDGGPISENLVFICFFSHKGRHKNSKTISPVSQATEASQSLMSEDELEWKSAARRQKAAKGKEQREEAKKRKWHLQIILSDFKNYTLRLKVPVFLCLLKINSDSRLGKQCVCVGGEMYLNISTHSESLFSLPVFASHSLGLWMCLQGGGGKLCLPAPSWNVNSRPSANPPLTKFAWRWHALPLLGWCGINSCSNKIEWEELIQTSNEPETILHLLN